MLQIYLNQSIVIFHIKTLHTVALVLEIRIVFYIIWEKQLWSFIPMYVWCYIQGLGIMFNMSYIQSRIMHVVIMERASWKDESNPTKYSKNFKIDLQGYRSKAMIYKYKKLNVKISQCVSLTYVHHRVDLHVLPIEILVQYCPLQHLADFYPPTDIQYTV